MKSSSSESLSRCKPVCTSGRHKELASDSATVLPTQPRRKTGPAARSTGSSSAVTHRKIHRPTASASTSTTDTSDKVHRPHRLGATPLLGKEHTGYEECSPIIIHPRTLLELNTRYPRRVAHEELNNYSGNFADSTTASMSYAGLCPRDPAVSLSRTQLVPNQQVIPASPGFRIPATLGNPHAGVAVEHVPSAQRTPRSSSSNLDIDGWPGSSSESTSSKPHKMSMPMRIHAQRMERPIEYEHILPCWNQVRDWDQRVEMQEDMMASSRVMPSTGVGNSSSISPGGCHHHRRLTTLPDQAEQFFYPDNSAVNMEWDAKPQLAQSASFTTFPRPYTSLQVPTPRTYHSAVSPQPQESLLSSSPNASPSRTGFSCTQQTATFPNAYSCMTPTCCNPPMTTTNPGRTSTANVAQQHPQNHAHSHFGGFGCPNMHQSRSPTTELHFHQMGPPNPPGPVSTSASNTSANMTVQMHNAQALRRAVRPPRTMLLNAAAAGAHLTNSRSRAGARQNPPGRRPYRTEHLTYTRMHHCRRVSIADCPHRIACRVHQYSHHHHQPRFSTGR